jgi:tRNA 2-thiouridine synthesizing protein A
MNNAVTQTLDARGLVCPMPTIRLGQAIRKLDVGDVIELWTDDPASEQNMAAWTRNTGHELLASTTEGRGFKYQVRRGRLWPSTSVRAA